MGKWFAVLAVIITITGESRAGLHLRLESFNELPSQWRGFLPDLRRLRTLASPGMDNSRSAALFHGTYADQLLKLESASSNRALTADEAADLGALYVRFGKYDKAVGVLRDAKRKHPEHFALAANLGTACQLQGDLSAAFDALDDAVSRAPAQWKKAEEAHRKLVQLRRQEKDSNALEALFEKPAESLALAQQLALWLPGDGRVLWLLGEVAHATGDVRAAANILDGCVSEFGMKSPVLRRHRQDYRAAVEALEKNEEHARENPKLFKSSRAIARLFDESKLPALSEKGVNEVPWAALMETTIARPFKPKFLKYVDALDGRRASLIGSMRPVSGGKGGEVTNFLLTEYAVGCWFCDVPEPAGIIFVELKEAAELSRNTVRVEGTFIVNRKDPEDYLFRLTDATVKIAD